MVFNSNRIKPHSQNTPIVIVGVFFVVAFAFGLFWLNTQSVSDNKDYIFLFSVFIAGIGWVVNIYYSTKHQRAQHTINTLLSHARDPSYHSYFKKFNEKYGNDKVIPLNEIKEDIEMTEGATYLLNEYEFMAAAIKSKDLDYSLMKNTKRGQICTLYRRCELYIKDVRGDSVSHVSSSKIYEHLKDLYEDWSEEDKK
jgi:hypothetical protein